MKRAVRSLTLAALLLAGRMAAAVAAPAPRPEFVQAVEFPYYLYPRTLWERELVWLKNIGIRTVEFSIPWNWHQLQPGDFDFTGRTSPRRDLAGFIKLLRRVGLRAWVRPLPSGPGSALEWPNGGAPAGQAGASAQRALWLKQVETLLSPQTARHGGPVEFVEGGPAIDAIPPPEPVTVIPATDPEALARSRRALEKTRGTLLWKEVEDALYPAGWRPDQASLLRKGAVGLSGDERPAVAVLRRNAALLRYWPALLRNLRPAEGRPAEAKLPETVVVSELTSPAAGVISISNRGTAVFHQDLRLYEPVTRHTITVPDVTVPPGESLWLPVNVSLGANGLCRACSNFSVNERLVYATAELFSVEYENGILAMEFAAPEAGEAVVRLERKPVGPFLAAGTPHDFNWDASTFTAHLPIPASRAPDHRVRIGIAIEEPENAGFFDETHRLIIGQTNTIHTSYSSAAVAARSRLRLPEGFTAVPRNQSPTAIDYDLAVPADAAHGDFVTLTLEADGMPLGRARPQLFRPVTVRLMEAIQMHVGAHTELATDPPTAPIDPRSGGTVEIALRNNWPCIQTYRIEAAGDGLTFFPAKTEISIGAMEERRVSLRIFADEGVTGLGDWSLRATSTGAAPDPASVPAARKASIPAGPPLPMRILLLPHNRTVAWSADLDGDGSPEYILESSQARAVFSSRDGGRWMEFTAKEPNTNFLPEQGVFAVPGAPVRVAVEGDALVFTGPGWRRTARLAGGTLTIDQTAPLPTDGLAPAKQNGIAFSPEHPSAGQAVYKLE